jgi:transposase InsO family protein
MISVVICGYLYWGPRIQQPLQSSTGALRTDGGGHVFTTTHFKEYYAELRVRRELTMPYTPKQNGVVERRNQIVMAATHCMLKAKRLPGLF